MSLGELVDRWQRGRIVVLDGAMGTELERRGVGSRLPLWSTWGLLEAPRIVQAIHRDYVEAGADIITANTFRTHRRSLAAEGMGERATELTRFAVELAVTAREELGANVPIAGSMAPVEDCYHPERVPPADQLRAEHGEMAENLAAARVDLILVETMGTSGELLAAAQAAQRTGIPFMVSVIPNQGGDLLGGEPLANVVPLVEPLGPLAFLVNCGDARAITSALGQLSIATKKTRLGAYANMGRPIPGSSSFRDELSPVDYAEVARGWVAMGARLLGGCCGTTPKHIECLARAFK